MKIKQIIFYYPSKITGGAEYFFIRSAMWLSEHQTQYTVGYVDYTDGFARKELKGKKVDFYDYETGHVFVVPNDSVVVVQLNLIYQLDRFIFSKKNVYFLFCCLHSLNLRSQYYSKGIYTLSKKDRRQLGEYLVQLSEKNVIKYMGLPGYIYLIMDLYQPVKVFEWLPLIVPINNCRKSPGFEPMQTDPIRFCWLGRLDKEKSRNIVTYMNELQEISKEYNLSLSLIGIGPAENYLRKQTMSYSYPIEFLGEMHGERLDDYLRDNTDIGLASGTSALEFSLRGKPVIIDWVIKKTYLAGERKSYTLTSESEEATIGPDGNILYVRQSSFKNKFLQIISDYSTVSKECYDFTMRKTPQYSGQRMIETINNLETLNSETIFDTIEAISTVVNRGRKRLSLIVDIKQLNIKALIARLS